MDRCAIFVDAGYLLSGGGVLYCGGTTDRRYIDCDFPGVTAALRQFAENHSGMPALRIYWYDAAHNAVPQGDHLAISRLPYMKLRLGHLVSGRQKGVDSRIVRDLMVLARERAIVRAYLFGGDEDLREGVAEAQDMGVQVVIVGLPRTPKATPADTLIREADEHIILDGGVLRPYFARATPTPVPAAPAAAAAPVAPAAAAPPTAPVALPAVPAPTPTVMPEDVGREFASIWIGQTTADEIEKVLALAPYLPADLDRQLIFFAQRKLGSLFGEEDTRKLLRAAFHRGLKEAREP